MILTITGALGHIGSYLTNGLIKNKDFIDLILIDNLLTDRYCSLFSLPKKSISNFYEINAQDRELDDIISKSDVIIHLAAMTNAEKSLSIEDLVKDNNLGATKNIVNLVNKHQKYLIYASSTSVYGPQSIDVDESLDYKSMNPSSPYAKTKIEEEIYIRNNLSDNQYVILRFGTICGTSTGMRFHTAINKFCWQAITRKPISVWKTAMNQNRPYLSLKDLYRSILHIIDQNLFDGNIYNIVTINTSVSKIIEVIKSQIPDVTVEFVESPLMNQSSYNVKNQIFSNTNFSFSNSVESEIIETISIFNAIK